MTRRRIDEGFWRQSSSGRTAVVKKKRRRTLAPAKRRRLAAGAGGRRQHGSDGEEENWDGSEGEDSGSGSSRDDDVIDLVSASEAEDLTGEFDDADAGVFEERRASFLRRRERQQAQQRRRRLRKAAAASSDAQPGGDAEENLEDELSEDAAGRLAGDGAAASGSGSEGEAGEDDVVFEGGFRLPADLYGRLFDYQRTAVKWMWELHTQRAGGIIGEGCACGWCASGGVRAAGQED